MLASVQKTWKSLSLSQRITLIGVPVAVLCLIFTVISMAGRPTYGVLFSNLSPEDGGAMTEKLKELKVDYRLTQDGRAIEVPEDKVYDLRLAMASRICRVVVRATPSPTSWVASSQT